MARRTSTAATPAGLAAALGSKPGRARSGSGGVPVLGEARSFAGRHLWILHTLLALTTGSALAVTVVADWIAWMVSALPSLLAHLVHLFGAPLVSTGTLMAIVVVVMALAAFCGLLDGQADIPEIVVLAAIGSAATAATGVPGDAVEALTGFVNSITIPPILNFLGTTGAAAATAPFVVALFTLAVQCFLRWRKWV